MFCATCGNKLSNPSARFCQTCGAAVSANVVPQPLPQQSQVPPFAMPSPSQPAAATRSPTRLWLIGLLVAMEFIALVLANMNVGTAVSIVAVLMLIVGAAISLGLVIARNRIEKTVGWINLVLFAFFIWGAVVTYHSHLSGTYVCQANLAQVQFSPDGTFHWHASDGDFSGTYTLNNNVVQFGPPAGTQGDANNPLIATMFAQLQAPLNSDRTQFQLGELTFTKTQ